MEDDERGKKTEVEVQIDRKKENKETDEDEVLLDEEFIKIEEELKSLNDDIILERMQDECLPFTTNMDHIESVPVSEWIEAQELIKELEIKLDIASEELNASEYEKSKLKFQIEQVNEKLKEREDCYHALQLDLRKLKEDALDDEARHNLEVQSLKQTLNSQEIKYNDLLCMKDAFDMLSLELDSASSKIKMLEGDLLFSAEEARKLEELSREKIKHAEDESKRAAEFEKLLEAANASAEEMKVQMQSVQEELKSTKEYMKVSNGRTSSDFSVVKDDLDSFKSPDFVVDAVDHSREISQGKSLELEDSKVLEHEKMLEVEKLNADAVEEAVLRGEFSDTMEERSSIRKELSIFKNRVKELEQKSTSEEAIIKKLRREISLYKDSEGQEKEEILKLHEYFTDLKAEHHTKISILQDIESKYDEEFKARMMVEISFKELEKQNEELREQLEKVCKEKEFDENAYLERDDKQQQFKDACSSLQERLALSEQKFQEADSLLSRSLAEKLEVEQKLKFLDESHKKALNELSFIKRELNSSKSQVVQWELKTFGAEALVEELKREVHFHKDQAEKAKNDMLELQSQFSDLKEEYHLKVTSLQNIELKFMEESMSRESMEIMSNGLQEDILNLKEKLVGVSNEKESLEEIIVQRDNDKQRTEDAYNSLTEKLGQSEEKLKEMGLDLALAFTEKHELERKLSSLVDLNKEYAQIDKTSTERSFDPEDLIRSSIPLESHMKAQMKEAQSKQQLLLQRNVELEKQLTIAELKSIERQNEAEKVQMKVSELEVKLDSVKEAHKKELSEAVAELTIVKEELGISKDQVIDWSQKYISEGMIIHELKRELTSYKDSEEKAKKDMLELQSHLSELKELYHMKVSSLQEVDLKYHEELKIREASEASIKVLEKELLNLQHQLVGFVKEKDSQAVLSIECGKTLQQTKDSCSDLKEKQAPSEEKLEKLETALPQVFDEKHDLEEKLRSLVEVNKESAELVKSVTQRNFDLQELIQSSSAAESEGKSQMKEAQLKQELLHKRNAELEEQLTIAKLECTDRQYELKQLQKKILDFELKLNSIKEAHQKELGDTMTELILVKEDLHVSRNEVIEWKKKSISEEATVQELKRDLSFYRDSEEKSRRELLELQSNLSDLMEENNKKMMSFQDVELKLDEEVKARGATEVSIKSLECKILNLQEEVVEMRKENSSLSALVVEHGNNLQLSKDACCDLEEKLILKEDKLKEMDSVLSQVSSEKDALEQRLGSIVEINKESAEIAMCTTKRNFDLEDLIRSSNAEKSELKAEVKEAELKLELSHQRNTELVEQLNAAEVKCSEREYKAEQLGRRMLELEENLLSVDEAHKKEVNNIMERFALVKEQLVASKNRVFELEQKSFSQEGIIQELKRELSSYKDSEVQCRKELLELQSKFSDLNVDFHEKINSFQDVELRFNEEFQARQATEISVNELEREILNLKMQLVEIGKEKTSVEVQLADRDNNLMGSKVFCRDLEERLAVTREKLSESDSVLSQVLSDKDDLEQKLVSLVQVNKESAEIAKSATKRNFDLEDSIRSSNAAKSVLEEELKEVELKLQLSHERNTQLEEQLIAAEIKCSDSGSEGRKLQKKISELEENLGSAREAHKKELNITMGELTLVKRELTVSKNQVFEWEHKLISEEAIMEELRRELSLYKDSEWQGRKELLELQTKLSDMNEEYQKQITILQDVDRRCNEELNAKKATETILKNVEREVLNLQKQVIEIGKEKASLDALLVERDKNLLESKDVCSDLKNRLAMTEEKLSEKGSVLTQVLSEKDDLEQKLGSLVEANKESSELAKCATQRNVDLEDLIRSSNVSGSELKAQTKEADLKLRLLHQRNTELEERLDATEVKWGDKESEVQQLEKKILDLEQKLDSSMEELCVSRNQIVEWEQKTIFKETMIEDLNREFSLYKESEGKSGKELLELQSKLSDLNREYHKKITTLQDVELKSNEEFKAREATEISLKNREREILNLQKQVVEIGKEKASVEALLVERDNNLLQCKGDFCELEEKLAMNAEILKERESVLTQILCEKDDLEQRLGSLVEINKESAELAKSATQRNFDLEDLMRSSNATESELKTQMKEAELKRQLLHQRNTELEEQLNATEVKCSDREYEVEQLKNKIMELEQKLVSVKEELCETRDEAVKWEHKSISEEAIIQELKREHSSYKESERKAAKELRELQSKLTDLYEEYLKKSTSLQDVELRFNEEFKAREATESILKDLEKEVLNLRKQLIEIGKEKASVEAMLVERDNNLLQSKGDFCELEEKLAMTAEKLKERESVLSQILSEKDDLEQRLGSLVEINKESAEIAKSSTQRSFDLEDLLRSSNAAESELKARMKEAELKLQLLHQRNAELEEWLNVAEVKCNDRLYEVEQFKKKILELEHKLGSSEKELGMSQSQVVSWEQKSISKEAIIQELKREISLYKDSEAQARNGLLGLQSQFSALEDEYRINSSSLEAIELKYNEEFRAREFTEAGLKSLEREILHLEEQLAQIGKEKVSLEALLVSCENKLQQTEETCCDLEEKLALSEKKVNEMESDLSQVCSEKHEFEQKLRSLVELNKESAALAKSATQRSFDLEDLVKSSHSAETEAKSQMKETESKLESMQKIMFELEKQLKSSELKCSDREYEIEQLQKKILELQKKSSSHEEDRNKVVAELSLVKSELDASMNQVVEWKQKSFSEGAVIEKLKSEVVMYKDSEEHARKETLELQTLYKTSEEQTLKEILELQSQLSDLKNEHRVKVASLLEFEHKYGEELKTRESVEVSFNLMEKKITSLEKQLEEINKEKEFLEALSVERDDKLQQSANACNILQEKLGFADEKLRETGLLLSQTLKEKNELEQRTSSLEKLQRESAMISRTVTQRNLDLEDIVRSSTSMESEVKAKLRDSELKLISLQQKNVELEEQMCISELKCSEREYEFEKLHKKITDLNSINNDFEEEKEVSRRHMQAYEDKVSQLESSLNISTNQNIELELQLKDLTNKCMHHESEASTTKKHSLVLEDSIALAQSKSKDAENKVAELVLQLESTMHQLQELEEQRRIGEVMHKNAEEEIKQLHGCVTVLSSELEAFRVRSTSLEIALQDANEKEKHLTSLLNAVTESKKSLEIYSQNTSERLSEITSILELLENELNIANEVKNSAEKSLGECESRVEGLEEELKSTQEKLEWQSKTAEKAMMKISDLEFQLESLSKNSETKLQEAIENISQRDSQIEELSKVVASSKEGSSFYQAQLAVATQKIETLQDKMEEDTIVQKSLQNVIPELERKVAETERKLEQSLSENEMMAASNSQLKEKTKAQKNKIDQLQELMNSINAEKEADADQLACHIKSLAELREQHSRSMKLLSETELHARETESKLQEAGELIMVKDSEARELNEKSLAIERQAKMYEERATKIANVAETRKKELQENLTRLRWLQEEFERRLSQSEFEKEVLSDANLKLMQELETSKNKLHELHSRLDHLLFEKEVAIEELHSSKAANDDLNRRVASEGERFQVQLLPVIEENTLLNKMLEETKKELKSVIVCLEDQLKEEKEKGELYSVQLAGLKAELVVKSEMQAKLEELQQEIISMQIQHNNEMTCMRSEKEELWTKLEETACKLKEKDGTDEQLVQLRKELHITQTTIAKQRVLDVQKEMERETSMRKANDEFLDEHEQKLLLEKYIIEIEEKLMKAESKCKEKEKGGHKMLSSLTLELDHMKTKAAELEKKVVDLEKDLQTANAIIIKQDMEGAKKDLSYVAELDDNQRKIAKLGREIMILEGELEIANTRVTKQDMGRDNEHIVYTSEFDNANKELEKKVVDLQNDLEIAEAKITKQDMLRDKEHIVYKSDLDNENKVVELEKKVVNLQNELEVAETKIAKQDILRDSQCTASTKELDDGGYKVAELEKKVADLQHELEITKAKIKNQDMEMDKHVVSISEIDHSERKVAELEEKIMDIKNELQLANSKITKQAC